MPYSNFHIHLSIFHSMQQLSIRFYKRIHSVLFLLICLTLLSACNKKTEAVSEAQENFSDLSAYSIAYMENGERYVFSEEELEELKELLKEVFFTEISEIHILNDNSVWKLYLIGDDAPSMEYMLALTTDGYRILGPGGICTTDTPNLRDFLTKCQNNKQNSTAIFSTKCEEPITEAQYRDAAVYCVTEWLKECGKEDTLPQYQNLGFEIAPERKNNFLAGGYVDGRKEFLAEVCFSAEYPEAATFYSSHEIAHYTKAGTFWEGVYLCARFCWEDGIISLLNFNGDDRFLNGFSTTQYHDFYEFSRRSDMEQAIADSYTPYMGKVVSKNMTMTENGRIINLDIYQMANIEVRENTVYGDPDFRTYEDGNPLYGTSVYFTDFGTSTKYIEYPKDFRLTFENYTNDGNPDYAILYDTDEHGAYYAIESVQSDGRVFNHSGRAYLGGIYVAGCFDPSPRLQRTETIPYIGWIINEQGEYVPTNNNGKPIQLPSINMYSDRLYLPDTLKIYAEDETSVTCFMWNNTADTLHTDQTYSIERLENEHWVTVAQGSLPESKSIEARNYAQLTYDLDLIADRISGRYRIVQQAGGETGYGEFFLSGKRKGSPLQVEMSDSVLWEGCYEGSFVVKNTDIVPRRISSITLKQDETQIPIILKNMQSNQVLAPQEELRIKFVCTDGEYLSAGSYTLQIDDAAEFPFEVSAVSFPKPLTMQLRRSGKKYVLDVNCLGENLIEPVDVTIYQQINGAYKRTSLVCTESNIHMQTEGSMQLIFQTFMEQNPPDETAPFFVRLDYICGNKNMTTWIKTSVEK